MDVRSEELFGEPRKFNWQEQEDPARIEQFLLEQQQIQPKISTLTELFKVLGVPNNARIQVQIAQDYIDITARFKAAGIEISRNALIINETQWIFHWHDIFITPDAQRQHLSTRMYLHALRYAAQIGLPSISLFANRGSNASGYAIFPKLGFNGDLNESPEPYQELRKKLMPKDFPQTVQDLLNIENGNSIWEEHGYSLYMNFDLQQNSSSWEIFEAYLNNKGIELAQGWLS